MSLHLPAIVDAQFSSEGPLPDVFAVSGSQSAARYCSLSLIIGSWKYGRDKAFLIVYAQWDCRLSVRDRNLKTGLFGKENFLARNLLYLMANVCISYIYDTYTNHSSVHISVSY